MAHSSDLARQALRNVRQRMLDLSKRNQLLNYQHKTHRSIDIIDSSIDQLYDTLVLKNNGLTLGSGEDELHTKQNDVMLQQCCRKLARDSRTALEETGSLILYLAMGWLHWVDETAQHQAPLLLVPVRLNRLHQTGTTYYQYSLSYAGEDIEHNFSLLEKLQHDYALVLPEWSDDTMPTDYLRGIQEIIQENTKWHTSNEIRLDLFSFNKLLLFRDLDKQRWQQDLLRQPNLVQLLTGTSPPKPQTTQARASQALQAHQTPPCILNADHSQQAALAQVLAHNKNVLVEGPPGTGKSQTITNLIVGLLGAGKTVLFMAEKKAALDVVRQRLNSVDMGDFCLELHSHKTQKNRVLNELRHRLQQSYPDEPNWSVQRHELDTQKKNFPLILNI